VFFFVVNQHGHSRIDTGYHHFHQAVAVTDGRTGGYRGAGLPVELHGGSDQKRDDRQGDQKGHAPFVVYRP
jgi:hypothetical protein